MYRSLVQMPFLCWICHAVTVGSRVIAASLKWRVVMAVALLLIAQDKYQQKSQGLPGFRWSPSKRLLVQRAIGVVLAVGALLGEQTVCYAETAVSYEIINPGLTGAMHTRDDGVQYSIARGLNAVGQAIGESYRYIGSDSGGVSAWFYDGAMTTEVGLMGAEHTRADGYHVSQTSRVNDSGLVTGASQRFSGIGYMGVSAWVYNGTATINIGLTGPEHTRADGYRYSETEQLNNAGQVVGYSVRYNSPSSLAQSSWLYNGTSTVELGLTGAEYVRTDGYQYSAIHGLNESGQVIGATSRFAGSASLGNVSWLYDGSSMVELGLSGAGFVRNDGYKVSTSHQLTQSGKVAGATQRFSGQNAMGQAAWVYDGAATVEVGLTGSEHTSSWGHRHSVINQLNESGQAAGNAERYIGTERMGYSAWIYDGTATKQIGLVSEQYTSANGYQHSSTSSPLNESGQIAGYSYRYNNFGSVGQDAWLFDGENTTLIGLIDSEHTASSGQRYSVIRGLNEAGQVIGFTNRYDGNTQLGQDAWLYDPLYGAMALQLSVRDDGYAFSSAEFLGDDGLVLGYYYLYSGMTLVGERAFYWTHEDGLWDLGSLVSGGLEANDWDALSRVLRTNGLGQVLGYGIADGLPVGSQSVFLLRPVPEPGTLLLSLLAIAGMLVIVQRHRACSRGIAVASPAVVETD